MRPFLFKTYLLILLTISCNPFAQAQVVVKMPNNHIAEAERRLEALCDMEWLAHAPVEGVKALLEGRYGFFSSWGPHLLNGSHGFCDSNANSILHLALFAEASPDIICALVVDYGASLDVENDFEITPAYIIGQPHNVEYRVALRGCQEEKQRRERVKQETRERILNNISNGAKDIVDVAGDAAFDLITVIIDIVLDF